MTFSLIGFALVVAFLDWIAVAKKWKTIEYIAKPGVMVVLLAWLASIGGFQGYFIPFTLGLMFSLAGDVFLMLPKERFVGGLVSFLLAHIAYIIGFNDSLPPINLVTLVVAILVALVAFRLYRRISQGLTSSGNDKLKIPVLVYSIVISVMLLSALLTLVKPEWSAISALLSAIGALLFFASDSFLAWNKFVQALPNGRLIVMVTYHLGQILIITGATLHYLS